MNESDLTKAFNDLDKQLSELKLKFQDQIKKAIACVCDENGWDFQITPRNMYIYKRGTWEFVDDNNRITGYLYLYKSNFNEDMVDCKYKNGIWED